MLGILSAGEGWEQKLRLPKAPLLRLLRSAGGAVDKRRGSRSRSSRPPRYSERLARRGVLQDGGAEEEPAPECEETDPLSGLGGLGARVCPRVQELLSLDGRVWPSRPRGLWVLAARETRDRLEPRLFCACASQAGPLGVKGAGVLQSGSVLEPEGDVAPPSGPSGARTGLIINSPPLV